MKPTAHRCMWFKNGVQVWHQYHDKDDPLPETWDDDPPTITELYTKGQLKEVVRQERERCAKLADDEFGDLTVLGDGIYNQLGDAEKTAQNIAKAIRALGDDQ